MVPAIDMSWLAFVFAVEFGYASFGNTEYTPGQAIYTELETCMVIAQFLEVGFATQCYMGPISPIAYSPWHQDYWAWVQLRYRGYSAGWRHVCNHPVLSLGRPDALHFFGSGNAIFLRYETPKE